MATEASEAMAAMLRSREEERAVAFAAKQKADTRGKAARAKQLDRRRPGLLARHATKLARKAA